MGFPVNPPARNQYADSCVRYCLEWSLAEAAHNNCHNSGYQYSWDVGTRVVWDLLVLNICTEWLCSRPAARWSLTIRFTERSTLCLYLQAATSLIISPASVCVCGHWSGQHRCEICRRLQVSDCWMFFYQDQFWLIDVCVTIRGVMANIK